MRRVVLVRVLLLAGFVAAGACRRTEPVRGGESAAPAVRVRVLAVASETVPVLLETSGTVRAVQRAALAAKIAGPIEHLPVALGQTVRAGEVLLQISATEYAARLAQSRAQLAQIMRELARERGLQAAGAGPLEAVRTLEDRLAQSQAVVREAETLLDYATVRAPFDGVVAKKHIEVGDFATPGTPLLQLDGLDAFEIEVGLPESAVSIAVGTELDVEIAPASRFRAPVRELSSAAESVAHTTTARLAVPVGTVVRSGQFARVWVPAGAATALLVPAEAVSVFGQMERVFTVDLRNRAALRLVKTGAPRGARVEILSGLAAGDRIVVSPPAGLRDGQPLDVVP